MPNGGLHHCGYCRWNKEMICSIRDFKIELPCWTTCRNWNSDSDLSDGPVHAIVCQVKDGAGTYCEIPYYHAIRVDTHQPGNSSDTTVVFHDEFGRKHEFDSAQEYIEYYQQNVANAPLSWDHTRWLKRFEKPSHNPDHYRNLRREVYRNTVDVITRGEYIAATGTKVVIDREHLLKSHRLSVFYPDTREIHQSKACCTTETAAFAIEADCLEMCRFLQLTGHKPAVLNMASNRNPGGGVVNGSGAQEENIFRRSATYTSLYQYVDFGEQYGVTRNPAYSYPIPCEAGGIYTPGITVFRSSERTGYLLLDNPYRVDLISVAAIAHPPLDVVNGKYRISDRLVAPTQEKIRSILRIGIAHQHDSLVLSAFGCGAFENPPEHMAEMFREVLDESEFKNLYKLIVFAIIDDHNAYKTHNPNGNLIPFQTVFNR